jgi:hypothetical protein
MRIVDVIPNDHSNDTNNDTEPNVAVNPLNPRDIIITAFTSPDAGQVNAPVFASVDGGETWALRHAVPGGSSADWTIAFATTSNALYLATLKRSDLTFNVDRTLDPTGNTTFTILTTNATGFDQPWLSAISVPNGPDAGKDRIYIGYNDGSVPAGSLNRVATVQVCLDALSNAPSFFPVKLESRNPQRDGFHIRPVPHSDSTVYAGHQSWLSRSGNNVTMNMVVSRDDNWGQNSFADLTDPSDNKSGRIVAKVVIDENTPLGTERPDNGFDIKVDPNNSDIVYISWIDDTSTNDTVRVRRSLNRGVDWSGDLITAQNTAIATLAINSRGTVALSYLQLVAGLWEAHFRTTNDGVNWDDTILARTALPTGGGQPTLGDYMRMDSVGPHFYGVFPAMNMPNSANFFPNGGGTFSFNRNVKANNLVGNDGVTNVLASVDPFFFKVEEKDVRFVLNRNPIAQDEVDARRSQPPNTPGGLPMTDVIRIVVDGFTATELGVVGPQSTLNLASPVAGMSIIPAGNIADTGSYGAAIQRFTFFYGIDFPNEAAAFGFASDSSDFTLSLTTGIAPMTVTGTALLTLIKQPDPFILHGDPAWLSVDLRVFPVRAGQPAFPGSGLKMGSDQTDAPGFIQSLMKVLTVDQFTNLPAGEQYSKLYTQPNDESGDRVFNFALAKVHYIGKNPTPFKVRTFFRMFQAQTTSGEFNLSTTYRRAASNPDNEPIPLAGIQGGEYVTIPFFAEKRINSMVMNMSRQTDPANVQQFVAKPDGSEVVHFFGCYLDINQPFRTDPGSGLVVSNDVLPVHVPATTIDGPFTTAVPIQSLVRNLHCCLIAEIAFDATPIPTGKDPGNWDKLAQRNIAWSDAGSATAVTTFDIRPTPATSQRLDELMIDWGKTRSDQPAQIYLPAIPATDIVDLAAHTYTPNKLTQIDDFTIGSPVGGITYIPLPYGTNVNFAGLLSIEMPKNLRRGQIFNITVRQITDAYGFQPSTPDVPRIKLVQTALGATNNARGSFNLIWRRVSGAFQLTIPVHDKTSLLPREESDLAVLRAINQNIPITSRWYPVFQRYTDVIAGRVKTFGGDPTKIGPSPTGNGKDPKAGSGRPKPCCGYHGSTTTTCSHCSCSCTCSMLISYLTLQMQRQSKCCCCGHSRCCKHHGSKHKEDEPHEPDDEDRDKDKDHHKEKPSHDSNDFLRPATCPY